MQLLIIAGIMLALMAQVGWGEEQIASCGIESGSDTDYTITPCHVTNNDIFNVAVIGDSIAWGNGLNKNSKYSYLVADWLQDKLNRPVEVAVYAHSGAAIAGESGNSIDPNLNCKYPTLMDQARNIRNKDDIDLILVSGGINDVGIQNILDANMPVESIKSLSESIKDPMTSLLTYLLDETNAKIIVTGYYPIITEESKVENQDRAVAGALALTSEKTISQSKSVLLSAIADPTASKVEAAWYLLDGLYNNILNLVTQDTNLRTNSDTFYTFSSISLENAVKDADKVQNRIIFVDPLFGRKNSYRASDSFLWELKSSDLKTNDDQYQERAELVEKTYALDLNPLDLDIIKTAENKINPIAHPNRDGSAKYADAIKNAIDYKGISWLDNSPPIVQSFQANSQSINLGESFAIDYTVSDSDGSGLKQVELWRKDETSEWQQTSTNPLAGETDPVSGSFTDSPTAPGKYWYGVHVVDNAGNWNDEKNSNSNGQPSGFEPVEVEVVGSALLVVQAFQVTPQSLNLGEAFIIDYTVSDSEGPGLAQVELWRMNETSDWQQISTNVLSGETDPVSGSFTDSPTAPGKYWYGVHVVDNAGNWNDEKNSNSNGQPSGFEPAEVEVVESALPVVQAFQVTTQSLNLGESFAIDYTVSDSEGSGLAQVELWRKDETSEWQQISTNPLSGETDPVSGSFTDSPTAPGKYWYGVHVVDNAGNWNDEKNSNSNGQPSGFEPVEVEVKVSQEVTLTLYVHNGSADGPVLSGVEVTGQDMAGNSFFQTTDENGYVAITGLPGSWQFTASETGYRVNSWSQEITETCTKHAFLFIEKPMMQNIIGKWSWFNGHTVVVHPDGTLECIDNTGTWELTDQSSSTYTLRWQVGGYIDILTLSQDDMNLDGHNQYGTHVTGHKTESSNEGDISNAVVGKWSWFNGHTAVVHSDGTLEGMDNTGTWELTDPSSDTYTLHWKVGGYIDILTLSQDGNSLNGNGNLYGTRITIG